MPHRRPDVLDLDRWNEAIPATVHGLDGPLCAAVVVDGPPGLFDPGRQCRLGDEAVAPNVVEQLLLGDQPSPLLDEVEQDVEDLRLDLSDPIGPGDFDAVGVDRELPESEPRH